MTMIKEITQQVDVANSKFIGFTKPRLEKRLVILNTILFDEGSDDVEIMMAASDRREVRECLKVFAEIESLGLDASGMTVADVLEEVTGESIVKLQKNTMAGAVTQDALEKTTAVLKKTGQTTKGGLNSFAKWLASKTE